MPGVKLEESQGWEGRGGRGHGRVLPLLCGCLHFKGISSSVNRSSFHSLCLPRSLPGGSRPSLADHRGPYVHRHTLRHRHTHFLCLSLTLIGVVALVTISYIFPGYHILLSAAQHTGVCNETSDEQCTHTHTDTQTGLGLRSIVSQSLYIDLLTWVKRMRKVKQSELCLFCPFPDTIQTFFSPPYCCLCCHWRWYLQARSNLWV